MNADEVVNLLRGRAETQNKRGYSGEASELIEIADLIESQQAQLAASQRRERAAVEDLYEACRRSPCNNGICVKKNCTGNIIPCEFEWRGPQEAWKGE